MTAVGIDSQALGKVVQLACRAPSVHNSQPWHLVAEAGRLRLFLAPHRIPRATDLSGRESAISCGALLDHISVAAAAAGWKAHIAHFPNPNDLDHLATVDFHPLRVVGESDRARAEAILARRTDRLPFAAPAGWEFIESALRGAVAPDRSTFFVLPDSARPELAQASRLTESLRRHDDSYHAELSWWTGPFENADGIPYSALPSTCEGNRVDVRRDFPSDEHPDRRPEIDRDRSVIVVLCTDGDGRREALRCGEALSGLLLEATMAGLATCTLTHLVELPDSRAVVRALTGGDGDPQVLVRIGQVPAPADALPATPRRPLADVLEIR
jgi:hypothetical protein